MIRPFHVVCMAFVMTACQSTVHDGVTPQVVRIGEDAPPGAPPGTCWSKKVTPAIIETITEQVVVKPAEKAADGTVSASAVYETQTRQAILRERAENWFQTPCAAQTTPDFVASVQRALKARDLYDGAVNGKMDRATRAAIRDYQAKRGLDSGILSLQTARQFGLAPVKRDGAD